MRTILLALLLFAVNPSNSQAQQEINRTTKLSDKNFQTILKAISAKSSVEKWEEIPWRPSFEEALVEARSKDMPILLWMMNGHPCGMT
jgi:hypothetical protein